MPEQQTSRAHWKTLLSEDFENASRWLTPTKVIASAIPSQLGNGKWLRVVEDEPFRYLAIDDDVHHVSVIDRADVTVFGVDWHRVFDSISKHSGLLRSSEFISSKAAWHWATSQPQMGYAFPIYLGRGPLIDSLTQIGDQTKQPFVLLRLRTKEIDALCGQILAERRGLLLSLTEATQPGDDGTIALTTSALTTILSFQETYLPKQQAAIQQSGFPTPPNCNWSAIKIRFLDIDTVSINAGGVVGRYHFSEMGFANQNNKRSSVQWELLRSIAQGHGTLTWDSPGANRKNQKRRERLSTTLMEFFGMTEDPIRWLPDQCGWQTLFALEPER